MQPPAHVSDPNDPAVTQSSFRFVLFAAVVAVVLVVFKSIVAADIHASAMFSDDYAYLNKSIYYVRSDWGMSGYIFQNVFAGILYPLLISPWMLFDRPEARIFTVFVLNAVMSGVAVFFGSLAVRDAAGRAFWPAPVCLAAFTPMFLFSFVAMTENLVFPLLAIAAWLCADLDRTLRGNGRLIGLCLTVAALPLVRAPGLAAGVAVGVLCLLSGRRIGWLRAIGVSIIVLAATFGPYLVVMRWAPTVNTQSELKREAAYLGALSDVLAVPWNWWVIARVTFTQIKYITIATGGFALPIVIASCFARPRGSISRPAPRFRYLRNFAIVAGLAMIGLVELHIIRKIKFDVDRSDFIFGRYVDPIAFMILLAGLAALPAVRHIRLRPTGQWILRLIAPLLVVVAVARVWNDPQVSSFNQTALGGFCDEPDFPIEYAMSAIALIAIAFQLSHRRRWFGAAFVCIFILWSGFSSARAMNEYVLPRAERIARSQEAATWLAENSSKDVSVGFDRKVFRSASPTWRTMGMHYQALIFAMHPRGFGFVGDNEQMRQFDFLFTSATRIPAPSLPVAWSNGDYVLYRVVDGVDVYDPSDFFPLSEPASPDLLLAEQSRNSGAGEPADITLDLTRLAASCCPEAIAFADCRVTPAKVKNDKRRLTLAWNDSTVRTPVCSMVAGDFALRIRAKSDGCDENWPRLQVAANGVIDNIVEIEPGRTVCYSVPFSLIAPRSIEFKLVFLNNEECGPADRPVDMNIYIEELTIVPVLPAPLLQP